MRVMFDTNVLVSAIIFPNDRINSLILKTTLEAFGLGLYKRNVDS